MPRHPSFTRPPRPTPAGPTEFAESGHLKPRLSVLATLPVHTTEHTRTQIGRNLHLRVQYRVQPRPVFSESLDPSSERDYRDWLPQ
jgi:hypothetical protein